MSSTCGICLDDFEEGAMHKLPKCGCSFCAKCLAKYFQFMIDNGHLRICCPSFKCCILSTTIDREEIFSLISVEHQQKYRVLLNNKVSNEDRLQLQNGSKARCPFCDHIFDVNIESPSADSQVVTIEAPSSPTTSTTDSEKKLALQCPNCLEAFCGSCQIKLPKTNEAHNCSQLSASVLKNLNIKKCPNCNYLIQLEGGCAQINCGNCHHVFCWHCLKSLSNDFLLLHYDSGPCKDKLGHSRVAIFFNRVQTISICLGMSILMLLASPVILVTLPCLLTSKCRWCCRRKKNRNRKSKPTAV